MGRILIIDDDSAIRLLLEKLIESMGHIPLSTGTLEDGYRLAAESQFDLILLDLDFPEGNGLDILPGLMKLPHAPEVIIITGTGDAKGAETAFNCGAWDYIKKPFLAEDVTLCVTRALQYHGEKSISKVPTVLKRKNIVGDSPTIVRCLDDAAKAAATDSSVLIWGETGCGKELFARAIHENSRRADKNFVAIDCGALPETLVESLLFGHEKGAFTGATHTRTGLVAQADGGTLFLDEIGELSLAVQKTLLRALQEHLVRPVGGKKELKVDFRLVAATHRNLEEMVNQQTFRSDLLFRIRGIDIELPPLRERIQDIQDIAHHKIKQLGKLYGFGIKGVSRAFIEVLKKHKWPGNVRELMNVLEHSIANAGDDPTLVPVHLPPKYRASLLYSEPEKNNGGIKCQDEKDLIDNGEFRKWGDYRLQAEKKYLRALLLKSDGRWENACRLSGLSKTRLYELLRKHNLSFSR